MWYLTYKLVAIFICIFTNAKLKKYFVFVLCGYHRWTRHPVNYKICIIIINIIIIKCSSAGFMRWQVLVLQ